MQSQYSDDQGGGMALQMPPMTRVVKRLILINAAVFLLQLVVGGMGGARGFMEAFALYPPAWNSLLLPVWQLLSYGFLHDPYSPSHILWNMLLLYMFGTWVEGVLGARRFLMFYFAALLIGGGAQLAVSVTMSHLSESPGWGSPILGASGAVLALVVAMATLEPKRKVIFIIVPMTLRTLALIVVGKDVLGLLMSLSQPAGGIAHIVHLGGALTGFLAIRTGIIWKDPLAVVSGRLEARGVEQEQDVRKKLDLLLDKISREGIQSLSSAEKKFLKRASKR